ncbi:hypothetical protein NPIL_360801 [Nephila pilipes]|uniref:Uncharacterized protein n=1 Tax=Nephila pilipes TaxID=299642 RepID=A0A8X6UBH5_NEPPI|nr:hypothetical protein NPIL_360801 [Nephila pilipes]
MSFQICLTTEKALPLFESLYLDCSDTPVERSSDEEMSIDDPYVASSFGFQNAENVYSRVQMKKSEQCVPGMREQRNDITVILIFSVNS